MKKVKYNLEWHKTSFYVSCRINWRLIRVQFVKKKWKKQSHEKSDFDSVRHNIVCLPKGLYNLYFTDVIVRIHIYSSIRLIRLIFILASVISCRSHRDRRFENQAFKILMINILLEATERMLYAHTDENIYIFHVGINPNSRSIPITTICFSEIQSTGRKFSLFLRFNQ